VGGRWRGGEVVPATARRVGSAAGVARCGVAGGGSGGNARSQGGKVTRPK